MDDDHDPDLRAKEDGGIPFDQSPQSVSRPRAIALVAGAFVFTTLTSLLVTGFQGLHPILVAEKVYAHLCTDDQSTNSTVPTDSKHGESICTSQALRYNLMLTIAVAALNIACFPAGLITDRFGPRVAGIISSVIMSLGLILFAVSSPSFDAYIPGYALLGIGGVFVWLSVLHLLNLFPNKRGFLVALFTAAEDASTGVFFFFHLIYQAGVSLRALFLGYTFVPLAYIGVILLQPKKPILAVKMENRGEYYPISRQPLRVQAKSLAYWLVVAWNCICCITTYFYLGNMHEQLLWLFGDEEAAKSGTQLFSLFFMIFPFATVPLTGWVLNSLGTWPSLVFVAAQMAIYGLFSLVQSWPAQYLTWFMFVICRCSFIGVSAHYVNLMFGDNFSSLMGFVWTIGGFSTLTNYLFTWILLVPLQRNFAVMMIIMTVVAVSSTLFLAFMVYKWSKEAGAGSATYQQVFQEVEEELGILSNNEDSDEELSADKTGL